MDVSKLKRVLLETTAIIRKGHTADKHLKALEVGDETNPLWWTAVTKDKTDDLYLVDCQLITIGVSENRAARRMQDVIQLLEQYPNKKELQDGPSYKHLIPVVGSAITSLRLFALGDALGLWSVVLPSDMGIESHQDTAAALGWLCITGYPKSVFADDHETAAC